MSEEMSGKDQRRRRSEETVTAIRFQLEYVHEHFGIELIIFADDAGLALAYAGDADAAELVAAFAQGVNAGDEQAFAVISDVVPGASKERLQVQELDIDGMAMYLIAFADPEETTRAGFTRAAAGVERIYRTTSLTALRGGA